MHNMTETAEPQQLDTPWTFGWRLRWALNHAGLSLDQIGEDLDFSGSAVGRWCRGENEPKRIVKVAIAQRCGVRPEWLIDGLGHPIYPLPSQGRPDTPKDDGGAGEASGIPDIQTARARSRPDNHSFRDERRNAA